VMEQLFEGRLSEFYETLAFHFLRGRSTAKAVEYLMLSGKKSLSRYAVEEADQYFREAYDILKSKTEKTDAEKIALIDLLNDWSFVYLYLGSVSKWLDVMNAHQELAESLRDNARLGMFYACVGIAHFTGGRPNIAFDYLKRGLDLGESCKDQKVAGYACTWLTWACVDLARFEDAAIYGEKAQEIAKLFPSDQYLYFKSLGGLGYLYWIKGDLQKGSEAGELLLSYGERTANSRSKVLGHWTNCACQFYFGDLPGCLRSGEKAVEVAEDPLYVQFGRSALVLALLLSLDFARIEEISKTSVDFCEKGGCHVFLPWAYVFLGPALIARGRMSEGMKIMEEANEMIRENKKRVLEPYYEYTLGKVFSLIAAGPKPSFSIMTKNIRFLAKNVPFASRKAIEHFSKAIEVAKSIGANSVLLTAYMQLGLFHKSKRENEQAKECLKAAIEILEKCGPSPNLEQTREALASFG